MTVSKNNFLFLAVCSLVCNRMYLWILVCLWTIVVVFRSINRNFGVFKEAKEKKLEETIKNFEKWYSSKGHFCLKTAILVDFLEKSRYF